MTLLHKLPKRTLYGRIGRILRDAEDLVRIAIRLGLDRDHVRAPDSSPGGKRAVSNFESAVVTRQRSARRFRRAYSEIDRAFSRCVSQRSQAIA